MDLKKTMLKKMAKGIKHVAECVEEEQRHTAIGFYKPPKAKKHDDLRQE